MPALPVQPTADALPVRPDVPGAHLSHDAGAVRYAADVAEASLARRWRIPVRRGTGIPGLLRELGRDPGPTGARPLDVLLSAPGAPGRAGDPHRLDLWRVRGGGEPLGLVDLMEMIDLVVTSVLPGYRWLAPPVEHPHLPAGRRIDVRRDGEQRQLGRCGLARTDLMLDHGLPPGSTGLAMELVLGAPLSFTTSMAPSPGHHTAPTAPVAPAGSTGR